MLSAFTVSEMYLLAASEEEFAALTTVIEAGIEKLEAEGGDDEATQAMIDAAIDAFDLIDNAIDAANEALSIALDEYTAEDCCAPCCADGFQIDGFFDEGEDVLDAIPVISRGDTVFFYEIAPSGIRSRPAIVINVEYEECESGTVLPFATLYVLSESGPYVEHVVMYDGDFMPGCFGTEDADEYGFGITLLPVEDC